MHRVRIIVGDITALDVDAIVNAANEWMLGGGGVDGAIHAAAGPELLKACRAIPEVRHGVRCPAGESRITPGFQLQARHVIHSVGPIWRGGRADEEALLARCYRSALALACEHGMRSIAFPAISCGAYGFPPRKAAKVVHDTLADFFEEDRLIAEVTLAVLEPDVHSALRSQFYDGFVP